MYEGMRPNPHPNPSTWHAAVVTSMTTPWYEEGGPFGRDVFFLTAHQIRCPASSVLTGFRLRTRIMPADRARLQISFAYTCLIAGITQTTGALTSPWASMQSDDSFLSLAAVQTACTGDNQALQSWRLVRDGGFGMRGRFSFTCSVFWTRLSCASRSTAWSSYGGKQHRSWLPHNVACECLTPSRSTGWLLSFLLAKPACIEGSADVHGVMR